MSEAAEVIEESVESEGGLFEAEGSLDEAAEQISNDLFPNAKTETEDEIPVEPEPKDEVPEKAEKDESVAEEKPDEKAEDKPDDSLELPASWKKDMQDKWGGLDKDTQQYVLQREEQMKNGLEKDRGDANLGRSMRDVMTPYEPMLKERGVEAPQAVANLLQAHYQLSNGTIEQKQAYFNQLAQTYGITEAPEGTNPELIALRQRLGTIESNLQAKEAESQQETESRISEEISIFRESHPHFDELEGDIAIFITGGYSLEDAYTKALNANADIKESEIEKRAADRLAKEQEKLKEEAAAAKKAKSVNVNGRNTNKSPTATVGTIDDTLRETLREIKNRK